VAPPAPKQPVPFCKFPVQLGIEVALLVAAAYTPFTLALLLVLAALALPIYCFGKAEAPEEAA